MGMHSAVIFFLYSLVPFESGNPRYSKRPRSLTEEYSTQAREEEVPKFVFPASFLLGCQQASLLYFCAHQPVVLFSEWLS